MLYFEAKKKKKIRKHTEYVENTGNFALIYWGVATLKTVDKESSLRVLWAEEIVTTSFRHKASALIATNLPTWPYKENNYVIYLRPVDIDRCHCVLADVNWVALNDALPIYVKCKSFVVYGTEEYRVEGIDK